MSNGSLYHLIIRTDYTLFINLIMNCSDDKKKNGVTVLWKYFVT